MLTQLDGPNFDSVSLTAAIEMLPFTPSRLGDLGLFKEEGVPDLAVYIENIEGKLTLVPTQPRGTESFQNPPEQRKGRSFRIPHIPLNDTVLADSVQGVRTFGSEDSREGVAQVVNNKLGKMKQNLEVTKEYHRVGAIQGNILDADGSTVIYNLFTEFGITQQQLLFDFTAGVQDMKQMALVIIRAMRYAVGGTPYKSIRAICGDDFWDGFISHETVKHAFTIYQNDPNGFLRTQQTGGFDYAGITWENYIGKVGNVNFIPSKDCRFIVEGAPDIFQTFYGPANFSEAVNTVGKPWYAKQERMKFDIGWQLHTQTNPLVMCTRPGTLFRGYIN